MNLPSTERSQNISTVLFHRHNHHPQRLLKRKHHQISTHIDKKEEKRERESFNTLPSCRTRLCCSLLASVMVFLATFSIVTRIPVSESLSLGSSLSRHRIYSGIHSLLSIPTRKRPNSSVSRTNAVSLNAMDSRQLRFFGTLDEKERQEEEYLYEHHHLLSHHQHQQHYDAWMTIAAATTLTTHLVAKTSKMRKESVLVGNNVGLVDATPRKAFFSTSSFDENNNSPNRKDDSDADTTSRRRDTTSDSITHNKRYSVNSDSGSSSSTTGSHRNNYLSGRSQRGYGPYIMLSNEERELFRLLRRARQEMHLDTTLRVAGGWVRDKLLATPEFTRITPAKGRLTSKYKSPVSSSTAAAAAAVNTATGASAGRQGSKVIEGKQTNMNRRKNDDNNDKLECQPPVDIDIALDDMLGREFAEHLNQYLGQVGEETHSVGVVLKNPEKSKHLETATMKVGAFWIDFVNLRAEEYTQDSRIPDLMRIGSPAEDAFRRDLTINSLFYNVNNGLIEDWTGRGFDDLRRGVVSTPLAPLTTLLDDPLRTLRSVRFAARLRFTMDDALIDAAKDDRVRQALAEKVSRERIGCEVDLMLRSPDPVGAMRLLINLNLAATVFPIEKLFRGLDETEAKHLFEKGLDLLSTNHDQLEECKLDPPMWCNAANKDSYVTHGISELTLSEDDESRRYLWYASFLKPLYDYSLRIPEDNKSNRQGKKANRSVISKLLVDELKRPNKEAEAVDKIMKGANDFKRLMDSGCDLSAVSILLSDIRVEEDRSGSTSSCRFKCSMNGDKVFTATENDPVWEHAMEFRLLCAKVMRKVGPLWRAALFLAMSEHINETLEDDLDYVIEGDSFDESQEELRERHVERYAAFATSMQRIGLVGIWGERPLLDGSDIKKILPNIPKGPAFRYVMEEQENWMTLHPCAGVDFLAKHLTDTFPDYRGAKVQ